MLPGELCNDKDFWRALYSTLNDDAMISFEVADPSVTGLLKMNGFANVQTNGNVLVA